MASMVQRYGTAFRAMGCQVNVWLEADGDGQAILEPVSLWVEAMEACLSRFRPASELSQLNARVGKWVQVSPMLFENILAAKQGARLTNGLFNPLILDSLERAGYNQTFENLNPISSDVASPAAAADWREIGIDTANRRVRLPARIDLGGVAKGWAAQTIADRLSAYGSCLVDIGGDMAVRGTREGAYGWQIAVREPTQFTKSETLLQIVLSSGSVVTSGTDYRRWYQNGNVQHHLIDPRSGIPATSDMATVTVIHPHAPLAEVYAKAVLMLGGEVGLRWVNEQPNGAALAVYQDGRVAATNDFLPYIVQNEEYFQ
jgi:thiamine biosynthesis lipoprotein